MNIKFIIFEVFNVTTTRRFAALWYTHITVAWLIYTLLDEFAPKVHM